MTTPPSSPYPAMESGGIAVTAAALAHDLTLLEQASHEAVQSRDFESYITLLRDAQHLNPVEPRLRDELIRFLMLAGRRADALPLLREAYKKNENRDELFYINYLYALETCGELQEARPIANLAAVRYPANPIILALRGSLHQSWGEFDAMIADYRKANQLALGNQRIAYTLGLHEMMLSDCREGVEKYALRKSSGKFRGPLYGLPQWQIDDSKRPVLIIGEQGIGDTLQFMSLLSWIRKYATQVGVVVADKLIPLLARSFPDVAFHPFSQTPKEVASSYDSYLPLGDLLAFCAGERDIPTGGAFLRADGAKRASHRARYEEMASAGQVQRIIGISWESINPHNGMQRSIPLDALLPLLKTPGILWVNLQYGNVEPAQEFAQQNELNWYHDKTLNAIANPDDQAAQIAALDGVITADNSTVHLAGGLGQKTLLLLSAASDWRWGIGKPSNRWYQSVKLLRQLTPLSWDLPVTAAKEEIAGGYFA